MDVGDAFSNNIGTDAQRHSVYAYPYASFAGGLNYPNPMMAALPNADVNFFESPGDSYDKRVIGSAGAFTWEPNEKITFAYATLWGTLDTAHFMDIIDSIGADIDQIKVFHQSIGVAEMEEVALEFLLGQDDDHLYIDNPYNESFEFEILDLNGRPLITGRMAASAKTQIRTTELPPGVYILCTTDAMFATKWIKQP